MINIAVRAARNAGDLIQRSTENRGQLTVNKQNNVTAQLEFMAEQEILKVISASFPQHTITGQEQTKEQNPDYLWLIEPLDGITNLVHGFPYYAVSIALKIKNKVEIAVIYNPLNNELFSAEKGGGAMLNNRRIRVNKQTDLSFALLSSAFPAQQKMQRETYCDMVKALLPVAGDIRRTGCTALDLANMASGRLDGCWGIAIAEQQIAAGLLLVQEAGGVVTDFNFKNDHLSSGNFISGNPKMHQAIYHTIKPFVTETIK